MSLSIYRWDNNHNERKLFKIDYLFLTLSIETINLKVKR